MQTAKIIKTVLHRHVQSATQKKQVRHIHVQTDIPATRRFRYACNQKCLVKHTECFNATHSCKKQMVKNVVHCESYELHIEMQNYKEEEENIERLVRRLVDGASEDVIMDDDQRVDSVN